MRTSVRGSPGSPVGGSTHSRTAIVTAARMLAAETIRIPLSTASQTPNAASSGTGASAPNTPALVATPLPPLKRM